VVDYDPPELILTVRAGTTLAEVQALVASQNQMLAFEPFDHGPLHGRASGASTIGGVVAAGIAGSARLTRGGARDHLLGFAAVSGRGEAFVAGGKVVKNVTGYDLPKLLAGSWGRLAALTEVTLKVLPAPRETATLIVRGLSPGQAYKVMARALGSQAEVIAAAHLPGHLRGGGAEDAVTALRLEGFGPSITARREMLSTALADFVAFELAEPEFADSLWRELQTPSLLADGRPLWRLSIPARGWSALLAELRPRGARWMADWAGGLVWLTSDDAPEAVRQAAADVGGHAMLIRRGPATPAETPIFHPQPPALAALEERVRRAFDPAGVFETGRFGDAPDAD
jgi:glycolate oxidase FAD binding subunit